MVAHAQSGWEGEEGSEDDKHAASFAQQLSQEPSLPIFPCLLASETAAYRLPTIRAPALMYWDIQGH